MESSSRISGNNDRNINLSIALRKENSRIPKFGGEPILKEKIDLKKEIDISNERTNNFERTLSSKIPIRRTASTTISTKGQTTSRSLTNQKNFDSISSAKNDLSTTKHNNKGSLSSYKLTNQSLTTEKSTCTVKSKISRLQKSDDYGINLCKANSSAGDNDCPALSARERVAENKRLKIFEGLTEKLRDMQTDFIQKFESLKLTSPDKLKSEYKFITLIKNDECKLVVKDDFLHKIPKKLPIESMHELKEKVKKTVETFTNNVLEKTKSFQGTSLNIDELYNNLEKEQTRNLCDLLEPFICLNDSENYDLQVCKLQKDITDSKKALQLSDKKIVDLIKEHKENMEVVEKRFQEKTEADILKKDNFIMELQKKLRVLEKNHEKLKSSLQHSSAEISMEHTEKLKMSEEIKNYKETIQTLNRKLNHSEHQLASINKDKKETLGKFKILESDLEEAKRKIQELREKTKTETQNQYQEHSAEIKQLKKYIDSLEEEKEKLENEAFKLQAELKNASELHSRVQKAENRVKELQAFIEEREKLHKYDIGNEHSNPIELAKLRQSEIEKKREIEKLRLELSKSQYTMTTLEEQIQRDQQLLDVRSDLINSLQLNDNSQRTHLEEMYSQVGEKNQTINELSNELRSKTEEFRNLFSTLSSKQMELSRQEHMIKLLEESNERSQMLRVKQEERIGRMQEEISHLKQTITIYQNNVLSNAGVKNLLFAPISSSDECSDNINHYSNERRRKRQVDINVKKYEA